MLYPWLAGGTVDKHFGDVMKGELHLLQTMHTYHRWIPS